MNTKHCCQQIFMSVSKSKQHSKPIWNVLICYKISTQTEPIHIRGYKLFDIQLTWSVSICILFSKDELKTLPKRIIVHANTLLIEKKTNKLYSTVFWRLFFFLLKHNSWRLDWIWIIYFWIVRCAFKYTNNRFNKFNLWFHKIWSRGIFFLCKIKNSLNQMEFYFSTEQTNKIKTKKL